MKTLPFIRAVKLIALVLLLAYTTLSQPTSQDVKANSRPVVIKDSTGKETVLYKGSYALFIGMSNYRVGWPLLPGVRKEAEIVKRVLESHGFNFEAKMDLDKLALDRELSDFIGKHGTDPENRLLVFFAGHGYTFRTSYGEEQGYFVPIDAPHPSLDPNGFRNKAIEEAQVGIYAKRIESKHVMFVFDACFSGSLFDKYKSMPAVIGWKLSQPVRQFITSGSADEIVPDNDLFCSQFERALNGEADTDKDGYITGTDLGEFLQRTVIQYTQDRQHPQYGKIRNPNLDKGDFVFALPRKPSARLGRIFINSHPDGADITIDGERTKQVTPSEILPLAEGDHRIDVRKGHLVGRTTVNIKADEITRTEVPLEPGKGNIVLVSTPPQADVLVDGRQIGNTPLPITDAPAGPLAFEMRKSGYLNRKGSVNIIPDSAQTLTVKLFPPASLYVLSTPPGADVELDGRAVGKTPLNADSLPPGQFVLKISSADYLTLVDTVNINEGQQHRIAKVLKSKYASLTISSAYQGLGFSGLPLGAKIFMDGKMFPQDSISALKLAEGEHEIRVLSPGSSNPLVAKFGVSPSEQKVVQVKYGDFTLSSLWRSAILPGWGQLHDGSNSGWVYMAAGLGSGVGMYLAQKQYSARVLDYDASKVAYSNAETNADAERLRIDMQEMYSRAKKANDLRTVAAVAGIVVYAVSIMDALLFHSQESRIEILDHSYSTEPNPTFSVRNQSFQLQINIAF
jgi:hypothetical protein